MTTTASSQTAPPATRPGRFARALRIAVVVFLGSDAEVTYFRRSAQDVKLAGFSG